MRVGISRRFDLGFAPFIASIALVVVSVQVREVSVVNICSASLLQG